MFSYAVFLPPLRGGRGFRACSKNDTTRTVRAKHNISTLFFSAVVIRTGEAALWQYDLFAGLEGDFEHD